MKEENKESDILLIPVSEEEFNKNVQIKFKNINEGFNSYNNSTIEGSEEAIISFLQDIFKINGEENSYVDFYYNVLNEEDKKNLKKLITKEDLKVLEVFEAGYKGKNIYFKLTKNSIPFITRLCTREVLFSTFYFTKIPFTIWGNYNKKFPVFYKGNFEKLYRDIAIENNISIV